MSPGLSRPPASGPHMPVQTVLRQYAPGPGREVTARGGTGRHLPPPRRPLPRVATQGIMSKGARRGGWHPLGCPGGAGLDECRRTRAAASPPPAAAAGGHTTAARRRPSLGCPAAERLERVEPGQLALPRAGPEHMKALRGEYCRGGPVLPEPRCAPGLRGRRQAAHRWRSTDVPTTCTGRWKRAGHHQPRTQSATQPDTCRGAAKQGRVGTAGGRGTTLANWAQVSGYSGTLRRRGERPPLRSPRRRRRRAGAQRACRARRA